MSYSVPIPTGYTPPRDGAVKAFTVPVTFVTRGEELLLLAIDGTETTCKKEEGPEPIEMELPAEGGFMVAVEKGMGRGSKP